MRRLRLGGGFSAASSRGLIEACVGTYWTLLDVNGFSAASSRGLIEASTSAIPVALKYCVACNGRGRGAVPGPVPGLSHARVTDAIRAMHERPSHAWTVTELAVVSALSRSAFFERFRKKVGIAPTAYLLAWRMALAEQLLRQNESCIAEIAERVGYRSVSAFNVAFTRCAGQSPAHYARASH